jgi:ABC-type branched-subunit amino acid transport system ATPase component
VLSLSGPLSHTVPAPNQGATEPVATRPALRTHGLSVHFVGVKAVDGIDLELVQGTILGVIGPNGAGKTTLLNAITGFQRPTAGRVEVDGHDSTHWPPQRFSDVGVGRTFQGVRSFARLTVRENVEAAALGTGSRRREARARTSELLDLVGLTQLGNRLAEALAYGDQRRLGLARGLAGSPRFLLLDEPAAGLNELESDELLEMLGLIRNELRCGLLVIEHDMRLIMRLCDLVHVIDYGKTLKVGRPADVQRDPAVLEAYLGPGKSRSRAREVVP